MSDPTFDRRIVPGEVLELIRASQRRVPCHLGGGAALAGAYLHHRLSRDVDLVCHSAEDVRVLVSGMEGLAAESGLGIRLVRDAGTFVRASVSGAAGLVELDLIHEGSPDLEAPAQVEGVTVESLADLRAAKITCVLSRSEPRDLVDLLFLDRAGFPPERDLPSALRKDRGIDPGVLAWLLSEFPLRPLPQMLAPLSEGELTRFREDLAARLRRIAIPE